MGLFHDAKKFGGSFYRAFSQAHGSNDLDYYFSDDPVIEYGICAGSCLDWVEHYLRMINPGFYTNEIMRAHKTKITTVQRALRNRDQSLRDLLILYGLEHHDILPADYSFTASECHEVAAVSTSVSGVGVINYTDPSQGRHVAVFYVDEAKNLYFMDNHRGDVCIPYPGSSEWLKKYFNVFANKCGKIQISHFNPDWNHQKAAQAFRSLSKDSMTYSNSTNQMFVRKRTVDSEDFDNTRISRAVKKSCLM